jgi:hypothetical protein
VEEEDTSGAVGELFSQLVGEVEKINEGVNRAEDKEEDGDKVDKDGDTTKKTLSLPPGVSKETGQKMPESVGEPEKANGDSGDAASRREEEDEEAAGPSKQSDDWVPEDAMEEDMEAEEEYFEEQNGTGDDGPIAAAEGDSANDDFGGYDPLKLAQMSENDLNDLDYEMDDDMDVTTEDNEIFDEHAETADAGEESLPNDDECEKKGGADGVVMSENVETDYGMDYTADEAEGVSLDQEEDQVAPLEEDLQPATDGGEAAEDDTLDDSKEDRGNDDAFEMEDAAPPRAPAASGSNDRSCNGGENLNEDCSDDLEPGDAAGGVEEDRDCINDDLEEEEGGAPDGQSEVRGAVDGEEEGGQ